MKNRTHIRTARPLAFLLLVAIFAALISLSFYLDSATYAQTETSETLETPALTARSTGANTVELSWTTVTGAVRYELWVWQDSATGWQRLDDGSLTSTSYTHGGLTADTTYLYTVRAVDANGAASAWSEYANAIVSDPRLPNATPTPSQTPTSGPTPTPTATASASELAIPQLTAQATESGVLLTWEPVPHAVRYELSSWWDAGTGWQLLGRDNLTGTTYTHTEVTSGTTYYYSIRALSAAGETSGWLLDYPTATALAAKGRATSTPTPTVATTDRGALIALYEATDGANWTHNDNWLTDKPLSTWYGVHVDYRGHIHLLRLNRNQLAGSIPDLSALSGVGGVGVVLELTHNQLTGPFPHPSTLPPLLIALELNHNQLIGSLPNLSTLTNLHALYVSNNRLTGPFPDLSTLPALDWVDFSGNQLCLPADYDLDGASAVVTRHLNQLNLPTCTEAELQGRPAAPKNLKADVGTDQVTLTWDAVANAVSYELWAWDGITLQWRTIGGALTRTTYTHPVLTDGRNYYYMVNARGANGAIGPPSQRVLAIVVPQEFPPPPPSLNMELWFQKYVKVSGVHVVAHSEVTDTKMAQTRDTVVGMLSDRADLREEMDTYEAKIIIQPQIGGYASSADNVPLSVGTQPLNATVATEDRNCHILIHEFAHLIHAALRNQPGGEEFHQRVIATYQAAMNAGLWEDLYASVNHGEYWAETVRYWFQEYVPVLQYSTLEEYDPKAAALIEETLGDATVPSYCKP